MILLTGLAACSPRCDRPFFLGRATKDDGGSASPAKTTQAAANVLGQANLTAPQGAPAPKAIGVAQFVSQDGQRLINVLAEGLPTAPKGSGYGVWLTGNGQQPRWLGYFQAVTTNGQVGAQSTPAGGPGRIPDGPASRARQGRSPTAPGTTYLTGPIKLKTTK